MNFVTLLPWAQNVHLVKDVGMIPFVFYRHFGFDAKLVCYNNGQYPYIKSEVSGLKLEFWEKITGDYHWDGSIYLLKNARKIDILHLFHYSRASMMWILIYKLLNPRGKIYLKLDANNKIKQIRFRKYSLRDKMIIILLQQCTVISVETKDLHQFLNKYWPLKVAYIPNGYYWDDINSKISFLTKTNVILTVGRLGTMEKATEILLQGFKIAAHFIAEWKLELVGSIEPSFESYINEFFQINPDLKERITFHGEITDRKELSQLYSKSKVFCITSRWEGFPLVFLEAAKSGCCIISSNLAPAIDITDNQNFGSLFEVDDAKQLAEAFKKVCQNERRLEVICGQIQDYAKLHFDWVKICSEIKALLDDNNNS